MIFIDNENVTDPSINLAIEEYILTNFREADMYLLFYVNEPSIIIGKNQNTIEEINKDYVEENNLHVVRRLSGGGAVYHDLGNLNFSFIREDDGNSFHDFQSFTAPVVTALQQMGVPAEQSGRNDLQADGYKISGNAQFASRGRMYSHGTLMLDSELENVVSALNVSDEKIRSKGIKSIRSRVANINDFLENKITMENFKETLLHHLFEGDNNFERYTLTEDDWQKIMEISEQRYRNWDWNYGKSPKYDVKKSKKFDAGLVDFRFKVQKGMIADTTIYGDFFGTGDVRDIETRLNGTKYEPNDIAESLEDVDTQTYFGPIAKKDILDLLY
ncbi:lipoate--protein ligase [Salicibibacter halophilus]|uniref:lipoate--protein ligase n=1 Tax=Salicibibacter halophilus TaxID=2502791 RepID=A0A514LLH5_9BACI|nr:lipoate--protein ligase [Salicibibacter halophilus]QDI92722.1 lipoate--protein ligase [Salicibibacter halophilus]